MLWQMIDVEVRVSHRANKDLECVPPEIDI